MAHSSISLVPILAVVIAFFALGAWLVKRGRWGRRVGDAAENGAWHRFVSR